MEEKKLIEFRNIVKSYDTQVVLKGINLDIYENEFVTLLGPSGCGKSTLLQLIAGLDQDYEGKILFNQVKIEDIKDYRQLVISFVYQNYQLIDYLSVKDNCLFYCHLKGIKVVEKQSQELLEIFELNELVNQKVKNLSGGQKQRLSIARAIAKDPEIFVFDDSFSALDYKTDAKLRTALSEKTQNKTVIIVAQRINTVLNADQIIVLDDGKIAGKGTHKELMQNCEVYKQIALSQLSAEELE